MRAKRNVTARFLATAVLAAGAAAMFVLPAGSAFGGGSSEPFAAARKRCHVVTKKVHGKKKRVRVCARTKPKPRKPAKCKRGAVTVRVRGKRGCMTRGQLSAGVPAGASLTDALIRLTFDKALWKGGPQKAIAGVLGADAKAFLDFDLSLMAASRAVGRPLAPDAPTASGEGKAPRARSGGRGGEETLGLDIDKTPVGWSMKKAEQARKWGEALNGVQSQKRITSATMGQSGGGESYEVEVKEAFQGDPCPTPAGPGEGTVDGTLTLTVTRTVSGFLGIPSVENVATVTLNFRGIVDKKGKLKEYNVVVDVDGAGGSFHAESVAFSLQPRSGPRAPSKIFQISEPKVSGTPGKVALARIVYQAIERGRDDAEQWLKDSEGIWYTKAACKKVKGTGLDKPLKRGEKRKVTLDISGIRGAHADERVKVAGLNGLTILSPQGEATAKSGKIEVEVQASQSAARMLAGSAPPALHVEGVSELGRADDTLQFKKLGRFELDLTAQLRSEESDGFYGTVYTDLKVQALRVPLHFDSETSAFEGEVPLTIVSADVFYPYVCGGGAGSAAKEMTATPTAPGFARLTADLDGPQPRVVSFRLDPGKIETGGCDGSLNFVPLQTNYESWMQSVFGSLRETGTALYSLQPWTVTADGDPFASFDYSHTEAPVVGSTESGTLSLKLHYATDQPPPASWSSASR